MDMGGASGAKNTMMWGRWGVTAQTVWRKTKCTRASWHGTLTVQTRCHRCVENHKSLPSADEEEATLERERSCLSGGLGELKCLLLFLSQAILRVTRSREGEFDMSESSLGGSELNSIRLTRRMDGETIRWGVT